MTPLDETTVRREAVAAALYEEYRIGAYSGSNGADYYPMWHELEDGPRRRRYLSEADALLGVAAPLGEQGSTAAVREEGAGEQAMRDRRPPGRRASDYWNFCKCGHDGAVHDLANHCTACDCARFCQADATPTPANERAGSSEMEEEPTAWRMESRMGEDDWYTFDLTEDAERARRFGKYSNCRVVPLYTRPSRPAACEITESEAIVCLCERYAAITLKDWHGGVTVWSPTPPRPAAPREEPSERRSGPADRRGSLLGSTAEASASGRPFIARTVRQRRSPEGRTHG